VGLITPSKSLSLNRLTKLAAPPTSVKIPHSTTEFPASGVQQNHESNCIQKVNGWVNEGDEAAPLSPNGFLCSCCGSALFHAFNRVKSSENFSGFMRQFKELIT